MRFGLEIKILRRERAFERVVGLIGRRGYELVSVSANLADGDSAMNVILTLESDRPADPLARQLSKLHEVVDVRTATPRDQDPGRPS